VEVEVEYTYYVNKGTIQIGTVRRRMNKRNTIVASKGPASPMAGIKTFMFAKVLEMESNREPLSVSEGLELANSLINDTVHQSELIKWKQTHLGKGKANMDPAGARRLGPNNWHNLLNRHPMLREKKHVKFDQKK
jgi:hypothetical protein